MSAAYIPQQLELEALHEKVEESRLARIRADVPTLEALLARHGRMLRAEIARWTGWDMRHLRAVAGESRAILRARGLSGYILIGDATAAEIYHAADLRRAQMRLEGAEYIRLRRIAGAKSAAEKLSAPAEAH